MHGGGLGLLAAGAARRRPGRPAAGAAAWLTWPVACALRCCSWLSAARSCGWRCDELVGDLGRLGRGRCAAAASWAVGLLLGGAELVDEVLAVAGGRLEVALALGGRVALAGEHGLESGRVRAVHVLADGVGPQLPRVVGQMLLGLGQLLLGRLDVGVGPLEVDRGRVVLLVELLEAGVDLVELRRDLGGLGLGVVSASAPAEPGRSAGSASTNPAITEMVIRHGWLETPEGEVEVAMWCYETIADRAVECQSPGPFLDENAMKDPIPTHDLGPSSQVSGGAAASGSHPPPGPKRMFTGVFQPSHTGVRRRGPGRVEPRTRSSGSLGQGRGRPVLAEPVGRRLARVVVAVGPVGLLLAVALVEDARCRRRCRPARPPGSARRRAARLVRCASTRSPKCAKRLPTTTSCCEARKQRAPSATVSTPLVDGGQVALVGRRAAQLVEQPAQGQASLLAGRALPARLDRQEARHAGRDGDQVVAVVVDDEAGRAEAAADGRHAFVAERRVEIGRGG